MKKVDLYFCIFLMAVSIFAFVQGLGYPMEFGGTVGGGFFPVWISGFLFVLSLANAVKIIRSFKEGEDAPFLSGKHSLKRITEFTIACCMYIVAIVLFGMYIATFLYAIYSYKIFDKFSWKASLPPAIGLVAFIYAIFVVILRINLPDGLLF
ncbi:MAG: tripartite tricarboxylate transporter TctB family protein [Treponema sp.]|nr:tripartite tricarboxylate transporter TctB family protein [Treponema sp.]